MGPPADEVGLWRIALDQPEAVVARLRAFLSEDERARAGRYHFTRDAARFVVGRGAVRTLLGQRLGIAPDQVRFRVGAHGKPSLDRTVHDADIRFNLAHSHDLALLAVAIGREVGVDLERVRPLDDADSIVARFFSAMERAAYHELRAEQKSDAFFRCWTRKEAYLKAIGEGLSLPLDHFDVTLAPREPARLVNVVGKFGESARWCLLDLDAGPEYHAALAVEGSGWQIRWFDFEPESGLWSTEVRPLSAKAADGSRGDMS